MRRHAEAELAGDLRRRDLSPLDKLVLIALYAADDDVPLEVIAEALGLELAAFRATMRRLAQRRPSYEVATANAPGGTA